MVHYNNNNKLSQIRFNSITLDRDDDGATRATLLVPGYNKSNISISTERGRLMVRSNKREDEANNLLFDLEILDPADVEKITASVTDGVLTIRVPHKQRYIRKIPIS